MKRFNVDKYFWYRYRIPYWLTSLFLTFSRFRDLYGISELSLWLAKIRWARAVQTVPGLFVRFQMYSITILTVSDWNLTIHFMGFRINWLLPVEHQRKFVCHLFHTVIHRIRFSNLVQWGPKPILPLCGLRKRMRSVDNRDIASGRTKKNGRASEIKDSK